MKKNKSQNLIKYVFTKKEESEEYGMILSMDSKRDFSESINYAYIIHIF